MITIREPKKEELEEMYLLRWEILRKPLGLPKGTEMDDKEKSSYKVIAFDEENKKIVGSARLNIEPKNVGKVRFVCTHYSLRSQGFGRKMMDYLHQKAKELEIKKIELYARKTAEGFYHRLEYVSLEEFFSGPPYNMQEVRMRLIVK